MKLSTAKVYESQWNRTLRPKVYWDLQGKDAGFCCLCSTEIFVLDKITIQAINDNMSLLETKHLLELHGICFIWNKMELTVQLTQY